MAPFTLRFDMRSQSPGMATSELYAAASAMSAWAETRAALPWCCANITVPQTVICRPRYCWRLRSPHAPNV